jgi:Protein of unknown function (DUF2752)
MNRKALYILLASLTLAGYAWLAWNGMGFAPHWPAPGICLFRAVLHVPCPSCGTTRAILLLLQGDIKRSLWVNPIGALLLIALVVIPFWILADILSKGESLHRCYTGAERVLRQNGWISFPLIVLVIVNWLWTIVKGL